MQAEVQIHAGRSDGIAFLLISLIFLDPQIQFDQVTHCNEQVAGPGPIILAFQENAVRWPSHDHRSLIIRAVACALNESSLWGPGAP